jgi:hypothetical protein
MIFDAVIPWNEDLDVKDQGDLRKGNVSIKCGVSEGSSGSIHYLGAWRDSETDSDYPHSFSISTALPVSTFEMLLDADLDASQVHLTFDSEDAALTYGYAPDGSEVNWDVGLSNPVKAENLTIVLLPQEEPEAVTIEEPLAESSIALPSSVLISDPQIIQHLRAIWWAIVIIGGLIVARVYLGR